MTDLTRRRFVAERYAQLQGARLVPLGVVFSLSATWRAGFLGWWPFIDRAPRICFVTGLMIALAVSFPIRTAYWRRFGRPRSRRSRTEAVTLTTVATGCFMSALLPHRPTPVSLPVMVIGLALVYPGVSLGAMRWHYFPIAAGWFVFAWLPLLGISVRAQDVGLDLLIGASLVIAGVGDDAILRRTLVAAAEESYVRTV